MTGYLIVVDTPLSGADVDLSCTVPAPAWAGYEQTVQFAGGPAMVPLLDRNLFGAGDRFAGPAIISQLDATTLVAPGWTGEVHVSGAILLTRAAEGLA